MSSAVKRKLITGFLALFSSVAFVVVSAAFGLFSGLSDQAVYALGILLFCIVLWVGKAMHEVIVAVLMCILFIVVCNIPTTTVFSTFASSTWWLLLAAFTIGFGMQKSGLMQRVAKKVLSVFPQTFSMQAAGLVASGTVLGPFIPSFAAKVTLLGPLSMQIAKDLGYKMKTPPSEGLFLAMYTGVRNIGPAVISASIAGYALVSTLPEDIAAKFDLVTWFIYMLPWFVVVSVLNLVAIIALYKPKGEPIFSRSKSCEQDGDIDHLEPDEKSTRKNLIKEDSESCKQKKMSRSEKKMGIIVLVCIALWITEPLHHVASHVVALSAMIAMVVVGVVSVKDIKNNLAWDSLIFIGCVLGIAGVFSYLGIDIWIIERVYPMFSELAVNVYLLVVVLALVTVALRFVIVSDVAFINIFMAFLVPLCIQASINPWIAGICIYAMVSPWFVLYQNPIYLAAYYATDAKMVRQSSMAVYCAIYSIICLVGLLLSIPFWQVTGVISFIGG